MFIGAIPAVLLQILLVAILLAALVFVVRIVLRGRNAASPVRELTALPPSEIAALTDALPRLSTQYRVAAPLVRLLPSAASPAVPLVELRLGKRPLIYTPTDLVEAGIPARYEAATTKSAPVSDVALFALCTLEQGGADAIQNRIKDFDKVKNAPDVVRLVPAQTQAGDYVVIARVLSHRRDAVSEDVPVIVYRAEVVKNADAHLVMELAVPDDGQTPFADGAMVHGTARMYGYLP